MRHFIGVGAPVILGDVRQEAALQESTVQAAGSRRFDPEHPADDARRMGIPMDVWLIFYCTCPAEETSGRATRDVQRKGWTRARALVGGMAAWEAAGMPMEPLSQHTRTS